MASEDIGDDQSLPAKSEITQMNPRRLLNAPTRWSASGRSPRPRPSVSGESATARRIARTLSRPSLGGVIRKCGPATSTEPSRF